MGFTAFKIVLKGTCQREIVKYSNALISVT